MGNTAQHCRLGLFQDSDFAGDLEDSKSTSGGVLRIFGSRTFVPVSWICKKQTSVSHSSTESESFLWMVDNVWTVDLWDVVIEVLRSSNSTKNTNQCRSKKRFAEWQKHFSGDGQAFKKVFRAIREAESHLHWQFIGIWKILWRLVTDSLYVNTTQIRNEWDCWESAWSKGTSVEIRLGRKVVVWFCGMLLLSSKCPRPLGRWENTLWTAIWRASWRPDHTVWRNAWISSNLCEGPVRAPPIW